MVWFLNMIDKNICLENTFYFTFSFLLFIFLNILFVSQNFSIKKILKNKFHLESHQSYLIVFILGLLSSPLALGRGDPGHILMGSVGIFLSSFYTYLQNVDHNKYSYLIFPMVILLS